MKRIISFLVIIIYSGLLIAQSDMKRLTEMQNLFFVSEASGLASTTNNPAALSISEINQGVTLGYDFDDSKVQGNSSVFVSISNLGLSYQDVYNVNNVRLQNYAAILSFGNNFFSIGTTNRYTIARYPTYELQKVNFDAGIILKPADFLSMGFIARNLGEASFDSLNYLRNYTAGIGLIFFDGTIKLYADADFNDNDRIKDLTGTIGVIIRPVNIFEFRGGLILNPDDITELVGTSLKSLELKYEAFISASFLIKDAISITAATRFNDIGEQTRISLILGFPFG
jgi:hypothetical protein